ncbi:hypothetical protein HMPREF1550_01379 [Actinomyces sp. oral taxon 877 str. F0543]|nr:hypothetical protein HMPREF1550_01379 [Actinomyces sp. oral taxon 877 str. F0543]
MFRSGCACSTRLVPVPRERVLVPRGGIQYPAQGRESSSGERQPAH